MESIDLYTNFSSYKYKRPAYMEKYLHTEKQIIRTKNQTRNGGSNGRIFNETQG